MRRYNLTTSGTLDIMAGQISFPSARLEVTDSGLWCWHEDVAELEKELAKVVVEAERLREENEKLKAELNKAYDACAQAAEDMYGLEG